MKKKNSLSLVLALVLSVMMVVSVLPLGAFATTPGEGTTGEPAQGTSSTRPDTGNPDWGDPLDSENTPAGKVPAGYQPDQAAIAIATPEDFAKISENPTASYYLTADLTGDNKITEPVYGFTGGTLDGNGHTIETTVSLFYAPQYVTFQNLILTGSVTPVAGENSAVLASNTAVGCSFFNILNQADIVAAADASGAVRASGIAGRVSGETVFERCVNEGTVKALDLAAGICALLSADSGTAITMYNCHNKGEIEAALKETAGGVVASLQCPDEGVVHLFEKCTNSGSVTSASAHAGGVLGFTYNAVDVILRDCRNSGAVTSYIGSAGGIFGRATDANGSVILERCTNEGAITANAAIDKSATDAGGIMGTNYGDLDVQYCENSGSVTLVWPQDVEDSGATGAVGGILGGSRATARYVKFFYCTNVGDVTSGSGYVDGAAADHWEAYAGGIVGYQYASGDKATADIRYCVTAGDVQSVKLGSYLVGYMNTPCAHFYNNVIAGTLDSWTYDASAFNGGASATNVLAWDNDSVLDPGSYDRNYLPTGYTGTLVTNKGKSYGSATKVLVDAEYPYFYETGEDPVAAAIAKRAELYENGNPTVEIATAAEFAAIATTGYDVSKSYKLTANIDLTGIDTVDVTFAGTLDGAGYTLTIDKPVFTAVGFGANIHDLTLEGAIQQATGPVGALAPTGGGVLTNVTNKASITVATSGAVGGLFGQCTNSVGVRLYNCVNEGAISGTGAKDSHIGGMVGRINGGAFSAMRDCINRGDITSQGAYIGGMVGECQVAELIFDGCVNYGALIMAALNATNCPYVAVGGIAGYNGTNYIYFYDCANHGSLQGGYVGGMIGDSAKGFYMYDCLNTGDIKGAGKGAGGMYNHHHDHGPAALTVSDCLNLGNITGAGHLGGIGGHSYTIKSGVNVLITNCISIGNIGDKSANGNSGGILGRVENGATNNVYHTSTVKITNCVAVGDIYGANETGGIVGSVYIQGVTGATVNHCAYIGTLTGATENRTGGILGYAWGSATYGPTVTNCYVEGKIVAQSGYACGLVGYANSTAINLQYNRVDAELTPGAGRQAVLLYGTNASAHASASNIYANQYSARTNVTRDVYNGKHETFNLGTVYTDHLLISGNGFRADATTLDKIYYMVGTELAHHPLLLAKLGETAPANRVGVYNGEALVGEVTTLAEAVALASDGYTIKLLADYYTNSELITVDHKAITLDGNGYTVYMPQKSSIFPLTFAGAGTIAMVNLDVISYAHAMELRGSLHVTMTDCTIYAGGYTYDPENAQQLAAFGGAQGTAISMLQHSNTKLDLLGDGNVVTGYQDSTINAYGELNVYGGVIRNERSRTIWMVNNVSYGYPINIYGGELIGARNGIIGANTVLKTRAVNIYGGTLSCLNGGAMFSIGDGVTRGDVYINLYSGTLNHTGNGNVVAAKDCADGVHNGTFTMYGGTINKSGISRVFRYYGNQSFYLYGGTINAASDDIMAFSRENTAFTLNSEVIFGMPADLVVPEGVTVEPLVINAMGRESGESLFDWEGTIVDGDSIEVEIHSGTYVLTDSEANIDMPAGKVTVYGGELTAKGTSAILNLSGTATAVIEGGVLTTVGSSESEPTNVIEVADFTGTLEVKGGTLRSDRYCIYLVNGITSAASVVVSGGQFEAAEAAIFLETEANPTVTVSGGSFTGGLLFADFDELFSDPDAYHAATASTVTVTGAVEVQNASDAILFGTNRNYKLEVSGNEDGTPTFRNVTTAIRSQMPGEILIEDMIVREVAQAGVFVTDAYSVVINDMDFESADGVGVYVAGQSVEDLDGAPLYTNYAPREVVVNNGSFVGTGSNIAMVLLEATAFSGTTPAMLKVNGGTYTSSGKTVVLMASGKTDSENFAKDGLYAAPNAVLEINGGVFTLTPGAAETSAVLQCGTLGYFGGLGTYGTCGTLVVKGGQFINQSESAQVVSYGNPFAVLAVQGGEFYANAAQAYFVSGVASADPVPEAGLTPSNSHADLAVNTTYNKAVDMAGVTYYQWCVFGASNEEIAFVTDRGAQVRLNEGSSGIRFVSSISAEMLDRAHALAGTTGVLYYGTVIAPFDYVEKLDGAFTMAALDACEELKDIDHKYVDIPAVNGITADGAGNLYIRAALTNIKQANYDRAFAAVAYVCVTLEDGTSTYYYGSFDTVSHVRSIKQISVSALEDVMELIYGAYVYRTADGKYSRYTDAQREILAGFAA